MSCRMLERPAAGPHDTEIYEAKLRAMLRGHGDAPGGRLPPTDLIVLITGLATSWMLSPPGLQVAEGLDPSSPERLAEHRDVVVEAARRIVEA